MALIIEDGSGVEDANSYVTVDEVRNFASTRGYQLPATDGEVEALILRAMDFVEVQNFVGTPTYENALQWPRTGTSLPDDFIPGALKKALYRLVYDISQIGDPLPTTVGGAVKREKVDVIETEYTDTSASSVPALRLAMQMMEHLLVNSGNLRAVRI